MSHFVKFYLFEIILELQFFKKRVLKPLGRSSVKTD